MGGRRGGGGGVRGVLVEILWGLGFYRRGAVGGWNFQKG